MKTLNNMAVVILGLVFAGAAAPAAGGAIPASAEVAVSTPHVMLSGDDEYDYDDGKDRTAPQVNYCGNGKYSHNVYCLNIILRMPDDD